MLLNTPQHILAVGAEQLLQRQAPDLLVRQPGVLVVGRVSLDHPPFGICEGDSVTPIRRTSRVFGGERVYEARLTALLRLAGPGWPGGDGPIGRTEGIS